MSHHQYFILMLAISVFLLQSCGKKLKNKYEFPSQSTSNSIKTFKKLPANSAITNDLIEQNDCALPQPITSPMSDYGGAFNSVSDLLQSIYQIGLTRDLSVRLALLNNPELLAYYKNLDVAYAGIIEAGLHENPIVHSSTRFPTKHEEGINKEFETAYNYLDYFLIPLRERAAEAELLVIESEFRQQVLNLVKNVELDWLTAQTLELQLLKESQILELKEIAAGLAEQQRKAGNINDYEAKDKKIHFEDAVGRIKVLETELKSAREKLNRTLGLFESESCWQIITELAWKIDPNFPNIATLEQALIANRPDIESIRREIYAIAKNAELKNPWTYANIKVGTSTEKEVDGLIVSGPIVELEVPIFNYGQGQRIKYGALLEQAQKKLVAKVVQALSELREHYTAIYKYRSLLEDLETKILPDLAQQVENGHALFNVMNIGIYELFEIKEREVQGQIAHLQAVMHYEKAMVNLIHAVGGSLIPVRKMK